MTPEHEKKFRSLRNVSIFDDFSDEQLTEISSRFTELKLEAWQPLFSDREPEEDFYIILSGKILISDGHEEVDQRKLLPGDFFIEEELLYGQPVNAYITTDEPTELLHLETGEFYRMLSEFPQIKSWFARSPESQWLVRTRKFNWLSEEEMITYVARKHEAILLFSLIGPVVFFLAALAIIFVVSAADTSGTIWTTGAVCSLGLAIIAILWGLWNWIDWGNDYYIVTDQRVVWVEKVVWLYESRDEAPLTTILAVNTTSSFFGRLMHYGSVIVKTFTGEITFRNLRDPHRMGEFIEEYRERIERGSERREKREIDKAIRQRLGLEGEGEPGSVEDIEHKVSSEAAPIEKQRDWRDNFGNIFTMRFEQGDVITYRKYWPTLFGKIWLPTLLILLAVIGIGFLVTAYWTDQVTAQLAEILIAVSVALIIFVLVPWWLYRYVDWRNDIYQVTDKSIIDIERKPLGTEVKKAAPVENILSLEHERVGFLGYMLNYGLVTINVGETQFVFRNVHDPARVQQDIFNRIYALRRQKEKAEAGQQRKRFVDVIEVYHDNVDELDEDDYFDDYDDDFGVELGPDGYP
jgi:hypothetical protein